MGRAFEGKKVLVTAGGQGIGRATAQSFLEAGARVAVCDIDQDVLSTMPDQYPEIEAIYCDVADEEQVDRLFGQIQERLGGLDILVNNAGTSGPTALLAEIAPEDWRRTLAVNLDASYLCSRRAIPMLLAAGRGGSIINLSSTAGLYGYPRRSPYAAAKWAIIGLTKSLAAELGPEGIRVNAICPGAVEGDRIARVIAAEAVARNLSEAEVRDGYTVRTSLRTFIDPQDIANTILFLCSDAAARITGQAIPVDGHVESL